MLVRQRKRGSEGRLEQAGETASRGLVGYSWGATEGFKKGLDGCFLTEPWGEGGMNGVRLRWETREVALSQEPVGSRLFMAPNWLIADI